MKLLQTSICLILFLLLVACDNSNVRQTGSERERTGQLGAVKRPSAADVYVNLAVEYLRKKQFEHALVAGKKSIIVDPNNSNAHNVIALIYQSLTQYGLAEDHFRTAIRLDGYNSFAQNAYGSFLCYQGEYDEAIVQFDNALENPLYPTPWVARTNAGLCAQAKGKDQLAEAYFRKALQTNKAHSPALLAMAEQSFKINKHLSSRAYLQRYSDVSAHTAKSLWIGIQNEKMLGDNGKVASYKLFLSSQFPDSDEAARLSE